MNSVSVGMMVLPQNLSSASGGPARHLRNRFPGRSKILSTLKSEDERILKRRMDFMSVIDAEWNETEDEREDSSSEDSPNYAFKQYRQMIRLRFTSPRYVDIYR